MIYLFYGNNVDESRKKCDVFLEKLFEKKPNASFFEFDAENFNIQNTEELLVGQGLFEREHVVFLRGALIVPETKAFVEARLKELAKSPNVFVLLEEKIEVAFVKKITAYAQKIWKSEKEKAQKRKTDPFALGDAFAARDRKKTWVLFCKAIDVEGLKPEQILGTFFSQVKNMLLVKREGENPGLHPFVYQKTKRCAQKYSNKELEDISTALVSLYHNARRGLSDMRIALEQFVLNL